MAKVNGLNKITGTLSNVTFYTIQGSEQVYVRTKGGPKKYAIKTKPQFEKLRRNNKEWSICARMGAMIRDTYQELKHLEDYPAIGSLNGLAKKIQKLDEVSEHGKRCIYLSRHKDLLAGFNLSKKQVLEGVLRVPITAVIDRENLRARVQIPAIDTRLYLYNSRKLPFFRVLGRLGGIADWMYSDDLGRYEDYQFCNWTLSSVFISEWWMTNGIVPAQDIELVYDNEGEPLADKITLMLTLGIEFGTYGADGKPEGVKYAGCGKILRVG
jgi:hypothetical protein